MSPSARLLLLGIGIATAAAQAVIGQTPPSLTGQLLLDQTPPALPGEWYMGLTITGEAGKVYGIEYTTDLSQPIGWSFLTLLPIPATPYLWIDTSSPATALRFYRAAVPSADPLPNLVFIPPGNFTMGSPLSEAERRSDETPHEVTLTGGFWMGKCEVTQGEYLEVIGSNPSKFRNGVGPFSDGIGDVVTNELRHPVEQVTWFDATNYCGKLTQREVAAGRIPVGWGYRLPTEAEWEYASRGGKTDAFHYGPALIQGMANFNARYEYDAIDGTQHKESNSWPGETREVGSYAPNAYGLWDMHGNVWEWCQDWYGAYPGSVTDPEGPATGSLRLSRGGSWGYIGGSCRSAYRYYLSPIRRIYDIGFRVVLAPGQ